MSRRVTLKQAGLHLERIQKGLQDGSSDRSFRRAAERVGEIMLANIRDEIKRFAEEPTGRLSRSYKVTVRKLSGEPGINVSVGSALPYARIHDKGGHIYPRRRRALTIPIHPSAKRRKARSFANTFIRNGIIYQKQGRGRKPIALYVLKRHVYMPPKFYLKKAARRSRRDIERVMQAGLRDFASSLTRG